MPPALERPSGPSAYRSATSRRASATAGRWTASPWSSWPGRCSACSARTAPARPPSSDASPAASGRTGATSRSWVFAVGRRSALGPGLGAAGDRPLSPAFPAREPLDLRPLPGPRRSGPADRHPREPRLDRPLRPRKRQDRPPLRRHAPAPEHRRRHDPLAPRASAGRADGGRGPPVARAHLRHDRESSRRAACSLLYTTHYMEEAERLCDRIAIIDHGKIIAAGTKDELVRQTVGTGRP